MTTLTAIRGFDVMGGEESKVGKLITSASESLVPIKQLASSMGRKWRRRRTLLGKASAEEELSTPVPEPPDDEDGKPDEDPWAASEPSANEDGVAESELDGRIGAESSEEVQPTQEILETDPAAVKMADASLTEQYSDREADALPDEKWLSADADKENTDNRESGEAEMRTLSDGLYDKLMQPSDDEDEELIAGIEEESDEETDELISEWAEKDTEQEVVLEDAAEEEPLAAALEEDEEINEEADEAAAVVVRVRGEEVSSSDSSAQLKFSAGDLEEYENTEYETESAEGSAMQEEEFLQPEVVVIRDAAIRPKENTAANAGNLNAEAEGMFVTDDDQVIAGESPPTTTPVYSAMPAGLLNSADSLEDDEADFPEPNSSTDATSEEDLPKQVEPDYQTTGAAMKNESKDSKNELATASRMERLKPKQANSLTGAPPPKIDGQVEDSVLAPETEVLLVAAHAPERNTFRTYLRRHDIPCRAAISAENAVAVVLGMKPAAILISGSCMNPEEIITLVDDVNDMVDAPILALLTESQIKLLSNDPLSAHVLQYPASLRHIRGELNRILIEEGNAKPRCSLRSALLPK